MEDLVYAGFIAAGATTIVIEAYRNFNAPSARHPFELHPILKEVEVRNLCTTGEIIAGFGFYAALYLLAYAVILSSAEVYGLLREANSALGEVGATDTGAEWLNGTFSLSGHDYSKPIIVSAIIISSLSIGAVKPIESVMRALSHRLAGVPRGVYRVIRDLRNAPYETIMKDRPQPLVDRFQAKLNTALQSGDLEKTLQPSRDSIIDSLRAIDCLAIATDSKARQLYFPLYTLEKLRTIEATLTEQLDKLYAAIDELDAPETGGSGEGKPPTPASLADKLVSLAARAAQVRSNVMAYFAVLYIRNDRAVFSSYAQQSETKDPIIAIRDEIRGLEKDEQNAFALSMLAAAVVGFIVSFLLYYTWYLWYAKGHPGEYLPFLADSGVSQQVSTLCEQKFSLVCEGAARLWREGRLPEIVSRVAFDQLQSGAITFISVLLVILAREVRMEQQSWRPGWHLSELPFLKMLAMSLLSGLSAAFLAALVNTLQQWWDADFDLPRTAIVTLFRESGTYFALQTGSGIILGMTALVIMDKHHGWHVRHTLAAALVGCVIYYFWQWAAIFIGLPPGDTPDAALYSMTTHRAMVLSALPVAFILCFAALLELMEANAQTDAPAPVHDGRANGHAHGGRADEEAANGDHAGLAT